MLDFKLLQQPISYYPGCERVACFTIDKVTLWHYKATCSPTIQPPLLITFALVNRPNVLDLHADFSLIKKLLARGLDIYLIDWGYPDENDYNLSLADYVTRYMQQCVDFILQQQQIKAINLLGVCQGGVLSLCYASLYPKKIQRLITMITPVDFHTEDNRISQLLCYIDVERIVETLGNIPGRLLSQFFVSLKPYELTLGKAIDFLMLLPDQQKLTRFLHVEKWLYENPDQAGKMFQEFVEQFYQQNLLIQEKIKINNRYVKLKNITMPLLNIYALNDHIVPASASCCLKDYVASKDYSELAFEGGHIGIYISQQAQAIIPEKIAGWLG